MGSACGTESSVLAVDVGNSAVKCAVLGPERWEVLIRAPTHPHESLADRLGEQWPGPDRPVPERCVISTVCPPADAAVEEFWRAVGGRSEPRYFQKDIPIPLETLAARPERVGTDRLLCALGARETAGAPCVVVGVGTAITVDLVDGEGRFAGGAIAPGPSLAARALAEGTACLPEVELRKTRRSVAGETEEAMRSGIYWLCWGGLDRLVGEVRAESQDWEAAVVVTGGEADLLMPLSTGSPLHWEPELIFRGMWEALRARDAANA